jgi:hypothetical protein
MSPEALEAEKLACEVGLTYLSREGYEKLAVLIARVRWEPAMPTRELPKSVEKCAGGLVG